MAFLNSNAENDQSERAAAPLPEFNNRFIAGVIGAGTYFAWLYLTFFSNVVLLEMPAQLYIEPFLRTVGFLAFALALLGALVFNKWMLKWKTRFFTSIITPFLPIPLYVIYYMQNTISADLPWVAMLWGAWVLFGISCLSFALNTSVFLSSLDSKTVPFVLSISILVGALIYLAIDLAQSPANILVVAVLPFVITICNYFTDAPSLKKRIDIALFSEKNSPMAFLRINNSIMPLQLIFGIVFGFAIATGIDTSIDLTGVWNSPGSVIFPLWLSLFLWLPGPILLIWYLVKRDSFNYEKIFLALMAISMCALLFIAQDIPVMVFACCCILTLCFSLFDYLHIQAIAILAQELTGEGLIIFCANRFFVYAGIFIGYLIANCLLVWTEYQQSLYSLFIAGLTAIYILFITFRLTKHSTIAKVDYKPEINDASAEWDEVCRQVCDDAKLSARQAEVFMMLAKGRNSTYIEKQLIISKHTVKAHMYRIYQKLDIHSQQDLIDMVESKAKKM